MIRIIHISDTHNNHRQIDNIEQYIDKTKYNILIHSGDFTNYGKELEINRFFNWLKELTQFDKIFFIAGNHELTFENKPIWLTNTLLDLPKNIHYLEDKLFELEINNEILNIYGSPWQPRFYDWAFNVDRDKIYQKWNNIPNQTDILITHGPPSNILDFNNFNQSCGCNSLREKINEIKPILNCFGHIHDSYGKSFVNETVFTNSSMVNNYEKIDRKPHIIDIKFTDKFEFIL
jgi:Icc-related predicted phosphoesterase